MQEEVEEEQPEDEAEEGAPGPDRQTDEQSRAPQPVRMPAVLPVVFTPYRRNCFGPQARRQDSSVLREGADGYIAILCERGGEHPPGGTHLPCAAMAHRMENTPSATLVDRAPEEVYAGTAESPY